MITWSPWRHLREWYPDVRVHEVELPNGVKGCVEHDRRIIWLDSRLTHGEQRATLAYQLGYLEVGPSSDDAEDWASRLLIPFEHLLRSYQRYEELSEVAEELWADVQMLEARLRGLSDEERGLLDAARWLWLEAG
jgi:hypothetical protein